MKKALALLLAAVLCCSVVLTGCAKVNRLDEIKKNGKLVMVTNAAFPPFEYLADDGSVAGVDADVAAEIAKELGVELEIVDMNFDLLVDAVKTGKGDIAVAGMTIKPERLEEVDFSVEYVKSAQYGIIKADSNITKDNLDGLTIAVQEATTGDYYATDDVDAKEVLRFKSGVEAAAALETGKCDIVIIDELTAKSLAANYDDLTVIAEPITDSESYAIAVQKEQPELLAAVNAVLERLIDEGKIDEFVIKHTGAVME